MFRDSASSQSAVLQRRRLTLRSFRSGLMVRAALRRKKNSKTPPPTTTTLVVRPTNHIKYWIFTPYVTPASSQPCTRLSRRRTVEAPGPSCRRRQNPSEAAAGRCRPSHDVASLVHFLFGYVTLSQSKTRACVDWKFIRSLTRSLTPPGDITIRRVCLFVVVCWFRSFVCVFARFLVRIRPRRVSVRQAVGIARAWSTVV